MPAKSKPRPARRRYLALLIISMTVSIAACRRTAEQPVSCPPGTTLMGAPPPKGEEVWCEKIVDGKPVKQGIFIVYGTGGRKMLEGFYRNGRQEGRWTMWYENGARAAVDYYHDGVQTGLHTSWFANGVKSIEGHYRDGKREGVWTRWDPSGRMTEQVTYKDDKVVR